VESDCWICAEAFVGSGVTLSRLAVVAARAVVVKSVAERTIVGGNPAVIIGTR
jgi:putative colanic acid biosynthesis acetyltransferase WcaF